MSKRIAILLPVFNGAHYLREQLESIYRQTHEDWLLYCLDDGSTDESLRIIYAAAERDERVSVIPSTGNQHGPIKTVEVLLNFALAQGHSLFALADQDDLWFRDKLESCLAALPDSLDTATLVSTDSALIDNKGECLDQSFLASMHFRRRDDALVDLLGRNYVQGCTTLFNRTLLELALPLPPETVMHDWWLGLCATSAGTFVYLPRATMFYRQHGDNVTRHRRFAKGVLLSLVNFRARWVSGQKELLLNLNQIAALRDRLLERGFPVREEISLYASLGTRCHSERVKIAVNKKFRRTNPLLHAIFLLRLLSLKSIGEEQKR